jgi:uncharacterized OB-fold protein
LTPPPPATPSPRADLPLPDGETQPFWDAARERRLMIKRCNACGRAYFYPRDFCPKCWSSDVAWEEASGRATLYTWSIVYRNDLPPFGDRVPYVAAVVDLEEGPRMMTNVEGAPFDDLSMGMPLVVDYRVESDEITLPIFRPAPAS